jgi:hypothetical protein
MRDVEKACERWVLRYERTFGCRLSPDEHEDMLSYLIAKTWELSQNYDASKGSFANYANRVIPLRAVDWSRQTYGRTTWRFSTGYTYERETRPSRSLDEPGDDAGGRMGDALPSAHGDPAADRDPDFLVRLLRAPSSGEAWDEAGDGEASAA